MGNQTSIGEDRFAEVLGECKGGCRDKWRAAMCRIESSNRLRNNSHSQCTAFREADVFPDELVDRIVSFLFIPLESFALQRDIGGVDTSYYGHNLGILSNVLRFEWSLRELDLSGKHQIPARTMMTIANVLIASPHKHRLCNFTTGYDGQIRLAKQGVLDCEVCNLSQQLECRGTKRGTVLGFLTGMMLAGTGVGCRLDLSNNDFCHAGLGSWPWMTLVKLISGADSLTSINLSNTAICGTFFQPESRVQAGGQIEQAQAVVAKSSMAGGMCDVKPAILLARHLACSHFEPHCSLTELDLSANALGYHQPSLTAILSAVGVMITLTSVDLSANNITDGSLVSSLIVGRTRTLVRLVLHSNPLGKGSASGLLASLTSHSTRSITALDIRGCGFEKGIMAQICEAVARRRVSTNQWGLAS
jgi:hypothetical protein